MNLDALKDNDCDLLIRKVNKKHARLFAKEKYGESEKRAIYRYLFSRRPKKLPPSMKSRLINLYDPLADRSGRFPDGLRWCLNVYVGCAHNCGYCYVNGYSQEEVGVLPHAKANFERKLAGDLEALQSLAVPPAPLHMSNSTDPLQEGLETENRHTLLSLQNVAEHRSQFSSVVILTKNPGLLCTEPYLAIIRSGRIRPFTVQVSCSFWRETARSFFEPNAPSVRDRLEALRILAENGIDVELRIDPLFPSSRIKKEIRRHKPLPFYSIPEAQSQDDIFNLIRFAKELSAKAVIVNTLKVPVSKSAQCCKDWFKEIYRDANGGEKRTSRGGSWRLPGEYQKALVSTVSGICALEGIEFKHCMHDLLTRS